MEELNVKEIKRKNNSIIQQDNKHCKLCGIGGSLHMHHVFYGSANRKKSDEDGLVVFLCPNHHNMSSAGVHFNHQLDEAVKKEAEKFWIKEYSNKEDGIKDFIARYHINYLDQEDLD